MALNQFKKFKVTYIDANISIYSVDIGCGPFIFSYKGMLEKYAKDYGMNSCDKKYIQKKYLKKCLRKYMKSYRNLYYNKWYMSQNNINYLKCIYEAYIDGMNYIGNYITGWEPYKFSQIFEKRFLGYYKEKFLTTIKCFWHR